MNFNRSKIILENLSFRYHDRTIFDETSYCFPENSITAIVGPSGIGKSTSLMLFNRLWESIPGAKMTGKVSVLLDGSMTDIYASSCSLPYLRKKVGTVFQVPNPLPMSIFKNVAFPLKLSGEKNKEKIRAEVESALKRSFLWDEVKDRLNRNALELSGGQQQRLCMARALILNPEVLLLDEPTSSLDKTSAKIIEDLLISLKETCTLLLVSHYQEQVQRVADQALELADKKFCPIS